MGLSLQFLTNVTRRMPAVIAAQLRAEGFDIRDHEVQTAMTCCAEYLSSRPGASCHLLVPEAMRPLFDGLNIDDETPDFVVIADIGEGFNFANLNRAFLMLRRGADLVVPQKNLFWFDVSGPKLDSGSFLLGLEAASGKQALVTGKPSAAFFQRALWRAQCRADQVLVIGDDVSTDIRGARALGARSVLLGTGKYRSGDETHPQDSPDHFLSDLSGLSDLLLSLTRGEPRP